jgi:PhnB protein
MATMNIYLNFNGVTEEAFNFYQSVLGGEFTMVQRFKDVEGMSDLSEEDGEKIMHMSLPIGNNILMGTDTLESMGQSVTMGTNAYISLNVDSKEEADRLYYGLSEGGKIEMELADMFWGSYFGAFADRYGVQWMIDYGYPTN